MIYVVSTTVFSAIILFLVSLLLLLESRLVRKGERTIVINDDPDKSIRASGGMTLLSALVSNDILLPSACGGGGSCGMCRCKVTAGGGDVLPTELAHLDRREVKENVRLACQLKVKDDLKIQVPDEIFNIRKYDAAVVSNHNVATFIKELSVKLDNDERLDFKAGAYMQIDIPEYEIDFTQIDVADRYRAAWNKFDLFALHAEGDEPVFRAYSLANPPLENEVLKFTVRIATPPPNHPELPPGVGSSYIFNLKPGDKVTLSGPYGEFFVKDTDREMCFVGGGAGMAPMRCHIRNQLLGIHTSRKMTFWYGARSKQEMFYDEEFTQLADANENFGYHVALSDPMPEDDWHGMTGFIHQCLHDDYLKDHPDPTEIEYYLCGPPMMIDAVVSMLDSLGVEPEMIAYDKF